jgi:ferredoxin
MRAWIDEDACSGCALCVEICPEVFEMDGDIARVRGIEVPEDEEERVEEAAEGCPVEAISID